VAALLDFIPVEKGFAADFPCVSLPQTRLPFSGRLVILAIDWRSHVRIRSAVVGKAAESFRLLT